MMKLRILTGLTVVVLAGAALAQTTVWVSSSGAKLKADTRATAETVAEIEIGTGLTVKEAGDRWYRVTTPAGVEGWIYRGKVSDSPPAESAAGGGGGGGGLFGGLASSRIEAGAADTSRSIRGLSPETEQYAQNAGTPQENRKALDRVLARQVEDEELERFLQAGQIGEYAP